MSVQHIVKCDGPDCEKSKAYYPPEWGGRVPLPDDWYILSQCDIGMEPLHFCSLNCVAGWAAGVKRGPSARLDITADTSESFSMTTP